MFGKSAVGGALFNCGGTGFKGGNDAVGGDGGVAPASRFARTRKALMPMLKE